MKEKSLGVLLTTCVGAYSILGAYAFSGLKCIEKLGFYRFGVGELSAINGIAGGMYTV